MSENMINISISSSREGHEIDLTVAEIGALLTAINRSLNQIALSIPEFKGKLLAPEYPREERSNTSTSLTYEEPALVELKVQTIRKGSIELDVLLEALNAVGVNTETAKALFWALVGNAIFDPEKAQQTSGNIVRGVKRVARSSIGKVFTVVIRHRGRGQMFRARVDPNGTIETQIINARYPPDDIQ